jgi:hypothetical protein
LCQGHAPEVEQFARTNSDRVVVVGITGPWWNSMSEAEDFIATYGITFTSLYAELAPHDPLPYTSGVVLHDSTGEIRAGPPATFSAGYITSLLDNPR